MKIRCARRLVGAAAAALLALSPAVAAADVESVNVNGPFSAWGLPTPPGAEGYEVNQAEEDELNPEGLDEWHPTVDPNPVVDPGQMRSDRETVPAGISKEEADRAEVAEAEASAPRSRAAVGCQTYWPAKFKVCGAIRQLYDKIGGPTSFLLFPRSNELTNPDGVGKRSEFNNGFIYWHPKTGAHTVSGPVSLVWARHGWERGFLGYPTTSDIHLGNAWYKQSFQGGYVYTHNALPPSQASIQGEIYKKWQQMGGHKSNLGFPLSDEITTPDGRGRFNVFQGGMIYWTPETGAHPVYGPPLMVWALRGFEKSRWGYPVSDPVDSSDAPVAVKQKFQHGELDVYEEIERAGTEMVGNKEMSSLLLEVFESEGIEFLEDTLGAGSSLRSSQCPLPDSSLPEYGGVRIPENYDYWACLEHYRKMPRYSLHDFCSYVPDQTFKMGKEANFRGACAFHDMCFEESDGREPRRVCNKTFAALLSKICSDVYPNKTAGLYGCRSYLGFYFVGTTWKNEADHVISAD